MSDLEMQPAPGGRLVRFVGDRICFTLQGSPDASRAFLRTNLGSAAAIRREIIRPVHGSGLKVMESWRDIALIREGAGWKVDLALTEVGYFQAKAYVVDARGFQSWPHGEDVGVSVHPNHCRTANTIYCAFPRMFGPGKAHRDTSATHDSPAIDRLEKAGYTVIPPSGTLRDLARELPHIFDTLGCRILHLLPVSPTPTVYARMGRFGSPYACGDLTAIDPALVVFDRRTTGVQQFQELADAVHGRGGWLYIDLAVNHTGWGSVLQENHPEWFRRDPDGAFASPGAWGNTWADLVELEPHHRQLWETLAQAFLTWCRRGVDGFRCDAGYKIPMPLWRYLIARVREEFPDTVFLLEGLGGGWDDTQTLLTQGGMQWAYSELFQELRGAQVSRYLDHALAQSQRVGTLVHYSETHDNPRLAAKGRVWSLLRNRLCALTSVQGAFGFTNGVEWLAPERVNVHSSRGLSWGGAPNLVAELSRLNHLLAQHPAFFDGVELTRLSPIDSGVYALLRVPSDAKHTVLVILNTDADSPGSLVLKRADLAPMTGPHGEWRDLLGQALPEIRASGDALHFTLPKGAVYCLATRDIAGDEGDGYRAHRARMAWALQCLATILRPEQLGLMDGPALAQLVLNNPAGFLAALERLRDGTPPEASLADTLHRYASAEEYAPVIEWRLEDCRRVLMVPARHWLLVQLPQPFRATLQQVEGACVHHAGSILVEQGHIVAFPPAHMGRWNLQIRAADSAQIEHCGDIIVLGEGSSAAADFPELARDATGLDAPLVLLTNGRGAMARMAVDLGRVKSKYDCLLAANLDGALPVDRHVLAKRLRLWANADGFISPLDAANLVEFKLGPPACWKFLIDAGDGRTVMVETSIDMVPNENVVEIQIKHLPMTLPADSRLSITARVDIEDRSFHGQTCADAGTRRHLEEHTRTLPNQIGFEFRPSAERGLRVIASHGIYHPDAEWSMGIAHPVEVSRDQVGAGDAYSPGWFDLPMEVGDEVEIRVSAESKDTATGVLRGYGDPAHTAQARLKRALDAFIVRRGSGKTVIAGYPWFLDWGRDALIATRGIIAAGRQDVARQILLQIAASEKSGTLPNALHGADVSNRDTSDAPLLFALACRDLAAVEGRGWYAHKVGSGSRTIAQVLESIATHYRSGTPNGIRMDPTSGLVWSPAHFTWMDTHHPACTPREGYPVEVQALWIGLLRQLSELEKGREWEDLARLSESSFASFFVRDGEVSVVDLLMGGSNVPARATIPDGLLRPNALFAIAAGLVPPAAARAYVSSVQRHLLVPGAVRTLAPVPATVPLEARAADGRLLNDPANPYWGRYEGDEDTRRKPAYHNGTAWVWLLPMFCEALVIAWGGSSVALRAARGYLQGTEGLLDAGCIGQLPEILDGDAPHQERGCDAQAWSVSETLRVLSWIEDKMKIQTP